MRARLTIGVHESLQAWRPEVEFVLRTLFIAAGYPVDIAWTATRPDGRDLYYGPAVDGLETSVWIPACGRAFTEAPMVTARTLATTEGIPHLVLDGVPVETSGVNAALVFPDDIVFASYWLLTGAREPFFPRSRAGDVDLEDSPLLQEGVLDTPFVSVWASLLRRHFRGRGQEPIPAPWAPDGKAAFAFTHDVDYPEILPWIEAPRLLVRGHDGGLSLARRILTGRSHYWTFDEWIRLAHEFGARPCFYFMARQGSLLQYALGTPDAFYDVFTTRFTTLFRQLRDAGAEIGLHASFHAHRSAATIRAEVERLERASGGPVFGNRHHYWHLDPADPNTTLARHAQAGLAYDSSLGFEYYPGFRRGICHPFRPYDPRERRVIDIVQLPPAWMDDHFDRRLAKSGIRDPDDVARRLVSIAAETGGIVITDYHARGMNREVYPRWGAWLERFARNELVGRVVVHLPHEIASMYRAYERELAEASRF